MGYTKIGVARDASKSFCKKQYADTTLCLLPLKTKWVMLTRNDYLFAFGALKI